MDLWGMDPWNFHVSDVIIRVDNGGVLWLS